MLLLDWLMEIFLAPLPCSFHKTRLALSGRLFLDNPVALKPFPPIKGKPQKIKGSPLLAFFLRERFTETNQGCLIRMKAQVVPFKPLWQNLHDPLCIRLVLKTDYEIVGPSNEKTSSL